MRLISYTLRFEVPTHRHLKVGFSPFRCHVCGKQAPKPNQKSRAAWHEKGAIRIEDVKKFKTTHCGTPWGAWVIQPAWREGFGTRYGSPLAGHHYRTKALATAAKRELPWDAAYPNYRPSKTSLAGKKKPSTIGSRSKVTKKK